jgi:hypothetical protein
VLNPSINVSEIQRIKHELSFNQLNVGAEPYVGITRYFEQIVIPNLNAGAVDTSTTLVGAVPPGQLPIAVALTLDNASAFNMFDNVSVDVDAAQETATVQSVTGNIIVVQLAKSHGQAGAYPIQQEGGLVIVRQYLRYLRKIAERINQFGSRAGVKKADEVEFFGGAHGRASEANGFTTLGHMQQHFRRELCMLLFGVGSVQEFGGAGANISLY